MEQFEYTFTVGMDESTVEERLQANETGVLSLADGDEAYGIPLAYHWDGARFVFRLGAHPDSEKMAFIAATARATFVVYDFVPPEATWSIMAVGTLRPLSEAESTELETREDFIPLRLFGEPVDDVSPRLYALEVETLTGRTT